MFSSYTWLSIRVVWHLNLCLIFFVQGDPLLPPDKKGISSRAWSAQLVKHQTFNLCVVGSSPNYVSYWIYSCFGGWEFYFHNCYKTKAYVSKAIKVFFGREKPWKRDKNFRHLSLNMVAKRDHESFKCFSLLWLKEMPFLLRRKRFQKIPAV